MTQTTANKKNWSEEAVARLTGELGAERPVSATTVHRIADLMDLSVRSIAAKLRNLEIEVASLAKETTSAFTADEGAALAGYVVSNPGTQTYAEIAASFADGKFSAKQVQGKILSLELTGSVKPSEKVVEARTYSEAEETKFKAMCNAGNFIEEIAEAMGKSVASIRGKALSMLRQEVITKLPVQKESHAKNQVDGIESLGYDIATMTVDEIAAKLDKTARGIKVTLTRRGITVADYDGRAKKAKADAKVAA
jgi:hypothetical protein